MGDEEVSSVVSRPSSCPLGRRSYCTSGLLPWRSRSFWVLLEQCEQAQLTCVESNRSEYERSYTFVSSHSQLTTCWWRRPSVPATTRTSTPATPVQVTLS